MPLDIASAQATAANRPVWGVKLVLSDGDGGSTTYRIADHDVALREDATTYNQWAGLLLGVGTLDFGYAPLAKLSSSVQGDVEIELATGHLLDQAIGHTILDALNAGYLQGATVTVYTGYLGIITGPDVEAIFIGQVYAVLELSRSTIRFRARADVGGDRTITIELSPIIYPNLARREDGKTLAAMGGKVGSDATLYWRLKDTGLNDDVIWKYLCQIHGGSPGRLVHKTSMIVRVATGSITTDDHNGQIRLGAFWPDDTSNPVILDEVDTADYSTSGGTITIPQSASRVRVRRLFIPIVDPSLFMPYEGQGTDPNYPGGPASTQRNILDWYNALDPRDLESYATIDDTDDTGVTDGLSTQGNDFVTPNIPIGASWLDFVRGESANFMCFILWGGKISDAGANPVINYGLLTEEVTLQSETVTITEGYGYRAISHAIDAAVEDDFIDGWGSHVNDRFFINRGNSNTRLKVYVMGLSLLFKCDIRAGEMGKYLRDDLTFLFSGRAPTTPVIQADSVLDAILSASSVLGLISSDFDTSTGDGSYASFLTLQDDLDDWTPIGTFKASIVESESITFDELRKRVEESFFIHMWRDPVDSKYKAVIKQTFPDVSGFFPVPLIPDYVERNTFKAALQDVDDVYNAIYCEFDMEPTTGTYRGLTYIDNSTYGSVNGDGDSTVEFEDLADAAQALPWGRRVKRVKLRYVRDAYTADGIRERMFKVLKEQRVEIECEVSDYYRFVRPGMILQTSQKFDLIQRFPGTVTGGTENEPSWSDKKFYVERVQIRPYRPMVIHAINLE